MNIQKSIKVIFTSAALTAVTVGTSFAQGNLTSNMTVVPTATTLGGTLITSKTNAFTSPVNTYSGALYSAVYNEGAANSLGGLTFVFQISNNASSTEPLDRFTDQFFNGFQTSAFYDASSGSITPSTAFRIGDATIGFRLESNTGNAGIGDLIPGTTSNLLVIRTDATSYTDSLAGISDGTTVNSPSYQPIRAVPEPATLVPFALGGLGLLGLIVRKTRRTNGAAA